MIVVSLTKEKSVKKIVVATVSLSEYRDVSLNNKCLRHSMNGIQNKNPKIGTYKISKTSLSIFDDKIYILNNGYDGLGFGF